MKAFIDIYKEEWIPTDSIGRTYKGLTIKIFGVPIWHSLHGMI